VLFHDFDLECDERKLDYSKREKAGIMTAAGLSNITTTELKALITDKLSANYIYNMTYMEEHDVTKFNIILELPSSETANQLSVLCALSYHPDESRLKLITLF
jgi:hypothetical protein